MAYAHKTILEYITSDTDKIFIPSKKIDDKLSKMLIIIPDLELTGSLTALMGLLLIFQRKGFALYVLSSEEGKFCQKLTAMGCIVFIRPCVVCNNPYRRFLQEAFDLVFLNTSSCFYYAYFFINCSKKVFWWFHETKAQMDSMPSEFLNLSLLSDNFTLFGVTKPVVDGIKERYGIDIELLPMPITDICHVTENKTYKKVLFFMPAAYSYIKGQDILLQAIIQLPSAYLERAKFVFCGYQLPGQKEYYNKIKNIALQIPSVVFLDEIERNEVYDWYSQCDCVIAPSRVDATPTTIVEAMMHRKLCIVSDAAGISSYMMDCVNGFIFATENIHDLMKRILLVIDSVKDLTPIAQAGRKIYQDNFSMEAVTERINQYLSSLE